MWLATPEQFAPADACARYRALLSSDEIERQERFVFALDRHTFLIAHALVRTTLSRYVDLAPHAWRFEVNPFGRPEIAPGLVDRSLRFNLSHTRGLVACAVTLGVDVGLDVEAIDRARACLDIADRFFAPPEVAALRALPPASQPQRFIEFWTLKESYIKARGIGLSLGLENFAFLLEDGQPISARFAPCLADDPSAWAFHLHKPTANHALAVSVRCGPGRPSTLTLQKWDPAGSEGRGGSA